MPHPLVVHCKRSPYDKYIGRPSLLGNPFSHKAGTQAKFRVSTREESVACFRAYAKERIALDSDYAAEIAACHNKVLGCWCAPLYCHGEVIVELAAELYEAEKKGL